MRASKDALSDMNHDAEELIQPVGVIDVVHGVKQPELHGKGDAVSQLDVLLDVLLVFETFKVEGQHIR